MAPGHKVLFLAMDRLQIAVAQELSSRYCPHSSAAFLARFWALIAVAAAAALAFYFAANRAKGRPGRAPLYIVAGALLLFALGSGALVLYGLSGCSGVAAEGLIWDWP
jgi:hypothetical protein